MPSSSTKQKTAAKIIAQLVLEKRALRKQVRRLRTEIFKKELAEFNETYQPDQEPQRLYKAGS